jgi:hypothetical protein
MCRFVSIDLSTSQCEVFRAGGVAHQYTRWEYWLCRHARDEIPCSDKQPVEGHIWNDFDARREPCPVCENQKAAQTTYSTAVQRAKQVYNATIKRAYDVQMEELEAKHVVEIVSINYLAISSYTSDVF